MVWKLQAVEPDTCEGVAQGKGCRYIELWNPEDPPETRTHTVVGFDRVCAGHADDIPKMEVILLEPAVIEVDEETGVEEIVKEEVLAYRGRMLWADGNWKQYHAYIAYQKAWFKHRNYKEWQAKGAAWRAANPDMPEFQDIPVLEFDEETGEEKVTGTERVFFNPHCDEAMPPQIRGYAREPQTPGSVDPPPQAQIDAMNRVYGWNKDDNLMKSQTHSLAEREGVEWDKAQWHFEGHGEGRVLKVKVPHGRERIQAALDIQHGPGRVIIE